MSVDDDLEGSLVLEQLATIDAVEEFLEAVDSDDLSRAAGLMSRAGIDAATIARVLREIEEG